MTLVFLWIPSVSAQMHAEETGRVVLLLPMSGDFEHLGDQFLQALQLALEDCPAISATVEDTRGDPGTARRRVEQIADDRTIWAIVGPVGTRESQAAAEAAERRGIPLLTLTSEAGIERLGPYVFRLRLAPQEQARRIARIAMDDLGQRRFAVLYPQDSFGTSAMQAFVDEVSTTGGRIMAIESYPPDETDFTLPIELAVNRRYRVLRGQPFSRAPATSSRTLESVSHVDFEAVFLPDYSDQVALVLHFLAFFEVDPGERVQLLGISSWAGPSLSLSAGLIEGALFTQIFHPAMDRLAVQAFLDRYQQAYNRLPTEAEAQAFDGLSLLCKALTASPPTSRSALREALLSLEPQEGLTGPMRFDPQGAVQRELWLFSASHDGYVAPYTILR